MRIAAAFLFCMCLVCMSLASAQDRSSAPEAGANLPARPLEAGDLTAVVVYGAPELSRTVRVSAEGAIRLPMLERRIDVAGLMPSEMEQRIADALVAEQILKAPAVTVTIAEYHSRPISVVGAVRQPLTFPAYGKTTLLEALARAQGLNAEAGTEILVTHPPRDPGEAATVERVSVKELIDGADPALNLTLKRGRRSAGAADGPRLCGRQCPQAGGLSRLGRRGDDGPEGARPGRRADSVFEEASLHLPALRCVAIGCYRRDCGAAAQDYGSQVPGRTAGTQRHFIYPRQPGRPRLRHDHREGDRVCGRNGVGSVDPERGTVARLAGHRPAPQTCPTYDSQ